MCNITVCSASILTSIYYTACPSPIQPFRKDIPIFASNFRHTLTIYHEPWKTGNMYDTGNILGTKPLRADGADLPYPCAWPDWTTSLLWDQNTTSSCTNSWQNLILQRDTSNSSDAVVPMIIPLTPCYATMFTDMDLMALFFSPPPPPPTNKILHCMIPVFFSHVWQAIKTDSVVEVGNMITDLGLLGCYMLLNGNYMRPESSETLHSVLFKPKCN